MGAHVSSMRMGHCAHAFLPLTLVAVTLLGSAPWFAAFGSEGPADLTGKVVPLVTLTSRDNADGELRYEVRLKNLTDRTYHADSLLLVLDQLTNLARQTRDPLSGAPLLELVEIFGQDGATPDGKPYFHVPLEGQDEFAPYAMSPPVIVRLRNPSFITGLSPSFHVVGTVKKEEEGIQQTGGARAPRGRPGEAGPSPPTADASIAQRLDALIELLIQKGVFTDEEWKESTSPSSEPQP